MANLHDVRGKKITIKLNDGVERELKFTLNAMAELEEAYGSVEKAFEALEKSNSIKALRKVLWAGLLHEENPMTEMQVGNLVDITYMQELVDSMTTALTNDMPPEIEGPVSNPAETTIADPNA
jgi:hypothetical protein